MPRMALWGALTMGVDISEPNTPPLVMLNVPPVRSSIVSALERAREAKSLTRLLDVRERQRIRVAQHRHDQAAIGRDRDADVVELVIDDVVAVDRRIDDRELLQRLDRRAARRTTRSRASRRASSRSCPCSGRAGPALSCRSTSLKVVSSACVDCACTRRSAMRARRRDIGTRCSARAPAARRGAGAATAGFGSAVDAATASSFVTRPPLPVPAILRGVETLLFDDALRRRRDAPGRLAGSGRGAAAAGAAAAGAAVRHTARLEDRQHLVARHGGAVLDAGSPSARPPPARALRARPCRSRGRRGFRRARRPRRASCARRPGWRRQRIRAAWER